MNAPHKSLFSVTTIRPLAGIAGCALIFALARPSLAQVDVPPPGPAPAEAPADQPGVETLTHGPIHEAFASPADLDPTPGSVVPKQPPADVPEDPPEYMPEGAVWLPGYWIWDDDRNDFIWVTGVARVPPPGMRWVPGYYGAAEGGWQRVSGFWTGTETTEVSYIPTAPPESLETGPSSPAPSTSHFWIPGSWNYYDTGYRWQAGYWAPYQPNWIWVPARWVWTPGGFVYIPGFWDYQMAYRGQMFAPVYFQNAVYAQPGWVYRPWCVIPTTNLFIHLWLRPRWGAYYFGNYYGPQFASMGFVPWANLTVVTGRRYVYDPFYTYARVHYRQQGVDYFGRVQGWHNYYAEHADLRPARTWREQQKIIAPGAKPALETQLVARNVVEVARRNDAPIKLAKLDEQTLKTQKEHADHLRAFNTERSQVERRAAQASARNEATGIVTPREGAERRGSENVAKLALPKNDMPATVRNATRGPAGGSGRSASVTPPPRPTPTSRVADQPPRDRGEKGPGTAGKTAKTGEPPGDRPRLPGEAGKTAKTGEADRDQPRVPGNTLPKAGRDLPGVAREPTAGRGNIPEVSPPRAAGDLPRVEPPGGSTPVPPAARPETGTPSVAPPNALPGAGRRPTPKVAPGSDTPAARNAIPRANPLPKAPAPKADVPRNDLPGQRGGSDNDRGGRAESSTNRAEPARPSFGRPPQPATPRVEPTRPAPSADKGGPPRTPTRGPAPDSGPRSDSSKGDAKGKSKTRDNSP